MADRTGANGYPIGAETTILASFLTSPRIGHLMQAIHIVVYLKRHGDSKILMDPTYLDIKWIGDENEHPELRREIMKTI